MRRGVATALAALVLSAVAVLGLGSSPAAATSQPQAAKSGLSLCTFSGLACPIAHGIAHGVSSAASGIASTATQAAGNSLGSQLMAAWSNTNKALLTSWLHQGLLVSLKGHSVQWLQHSLTGVAVALAVMGLMVGAIFTMATNNTEHLQMSAGGIIRLIFVVGMGTAVLTTLMPLGDEFSQWILQQSGIQSGKALVATGGLAIVAGFIGLLCTIFQWGLLLARMAVLPLLAGVWPVTAAASAIRGGEQAFATVTRWMLAALLFKPACAIVYAFAWNLQSSSQTGAVINGLLLTILAVLTAPALARMIAPATSALGRMSGGMMAVGAVGAAVGAGVAMGSAIVTGGGSMAAMGGGGQMGSTGVKDALAPGSDTSPTSGPPNTDPGPEGPPGGSPPPSNDGGSDTGSPAAGSPPPTPSGGNGSNVAGAAGSVAGQAIASGSQINENDVVGGDEK